MLAREADADAIMATAWFTITIVVLTPIYGAVVGSYHAPEVVGKPVMRFIDEFASKRVRDEYVVLLHRYHEAFHDLSELQLLDIFTLFSDQVKRSSHEFQQSNLPIDHKEEETSKAIHKDQEDASPTKSGNDDDGG
jgi:hypothetical protein